MNSNWLVILGALVLFIGIFQLSSAVPLFESDEVENSRFRRSGAFGNFDKVYFDRLASPRLAGTNAGLSRGSSSNFLWDNTDYNLLVDSHESVDH